MPKNLMLYLIGGLLLGVAIYWRGCIDNNHRWEEARQQRLHEIDSTRKVHDSLVARIAEEDARHRAEEARERARSDSLQLEIVAANRRTARTTADLADAEAKLAQAKNLPDSLAACLGVRETCLAKVAAVEAELVTTQEAKTADSSRVQRLTRSLFLSDSTIRLKDQRIHWLETNPIVPKPSGFRLFGWKPSGTVLFVAGAIAGVTVTALAK